ncbi:hypothetical protein LAZ67_X004846, partial [Cordylochernes scorpioides]
MEGERMEVSNMFSVLADSQYDGEQNGAIPFGVTTTNAEISAENNSVKNVSISETNEKYAKSPVTSGGYANSPQSSRNWADIVENDENFEQPKKRKRLLPSESASQSLPGPSRQTKTTRDSTTPRQPSCPRNTIEQIKVSRQMLAQCRSKAAAGTYDQMTYLEFSPEFTQVDYIKALENKLGKGCVVQIGKASGQILVGFERPDMAETIIEDGLMIKGALLKALPYQKKAEKITISGLPFVIEDADIIRTLRPYCQVVSIAPTVNSSGGYTWLDLKKTAFILMNNGKKITDLPKKIIVTAKGGSALAYLEYGFRCSKCYRMGHKRMNCPRIIRETSTTQPLSQTSSVKTTAPAPNTTAAASPPATFSHPEPVAAPAQTSSAPPAQEDIALETEPTTRTPETSTQTDLNINRVENSSHHKIKDRSRSLSPKAGSTTQLQLDTLLERLPGSFFEEVTLLGLKEEEHAVDIAFIQETNVTTLDSVEDLCLGYRAAVVPASGARGSGLACIFSSGVQVIGQQVLSPGKIAAFDVTIRGSKATFVNCHLSHAPDERLQQLQVIAAAAVNEDAWVLGDLNISEESASDIASGSVEALGELLDRANLVDAAAIFDATHLPTRISSCGSRVDASRLDRVLIPSSFSNRVTRYWSLYYKNSDHRAVLLQTGEASEPRPPCIASMLRSRLVVGTVETLLDEALGNIEDMRNAEIWRRWGHIKAHLASAIKSLHDQRNNDDDYISRARKYVQAKLEDVSIYSDYPSLPDLGRALRLRRRGTSSNTFYDSAGRMITGPAVRELAFVNLKERFSHPSCSPEDIDGFLRGFTLRVTIEESDPLHRYGIGEEEIVAAIGRLPTGKAAGWDDLPCELFRGFEDYFASALRRVFEASQLCGALPTSMRRSEMSLIEKPHGGPGLAGLRPLSLPTTDYRVLSGVLYWRLRPHLRDIVPECQSYAVPGRTPAWNIARVADEVATACRDEAPLAVVAIDLESAFDTLDRGFLVSTLLSVGLPPVFVGWVLLLYAGAEAAARIEGIGRTPLFHMLNGVRQGCAASAAFFTISTGPLLLRLEQLLGRDNVLAYADDIVLLIREDGQLEVVRKIFEDFRRASGIRVNFGKSQGLWCGRWRNRTDSPSAISWNREKINILGTLVTPGMGTSAQDQHLQELLDETTIGRLQARLARFVWGHDRTSWLPSSILARPISVGGMGLLDVGTQLRLSCLKGVQAALRGGRNAHSWLAESGMWLTPASTPGIWLPPRRRRSLHLFESAAEILDLNHRILQPALLRALRVVGDCRFLRPPELLAPTRWLGWRIGELTGPAPNITIATRGALTDVAALGSFCTRLITQNARGRYRVDSLADAIVVRGTTTAFQRLTTRTARRLLERPRLAALPITQLFGRWFPHVSIPISISWSSLRRCAFSGHNADVAVRLALHALPHPAHPASARESCIACGSGDLSLAHRYWSCSRIRPVILEAFTILQRPPDLQSWIFGHDLEDDALAIMASAKTRIYKLAESQDDVKDDGGTPTQKKPTNAEKSAEEVSKLDLKNTFLIKQTNGDYVNQAAEKKQAYANWAERVEASEKQSALESDWKFPKSNKRKGQESPTQPTKMAKAEAIAARPSLQPRQERKDTVTQVKSSRQQQELAKARSAAATFDQGCFIEWCPDFHQVQYMKALEQMMGKSSVYQLMKMSGHVLVTLSSTEKIERLIEEGLTIGSTFLRAFPYRKKAEKITIGNLPIAVIDEDIVAALRPYCKVASMAYEVVTCEGYTWTTGSREAFVLLNEGRKLHQLPVKLVIISKGESTPAYITYGVRCSKCHRQGHRRATCPLGTPQSRPAHLQDNQNGLLSTILSSQPKSLQKSAAPTSAALGPDTTRQTPSGPSSPATSLPVANLSNPPQVTPVTEPSASAPNANRLTPLQLPSSASSQKSSVNTPAPAPTITTAAPPPAASDHPAPEAAPVQMTLTPTAHKDKTPEPAPSTSIPESSNAQTERPPRYAEDMVEELLYKLNSRSVLRPLYIQTEMVARAVFYSQEKEEVLVSLTPDERNILAELLGRAIASIGDSDHYITQKLSEFKVAYFTEDQYFLALEAKLGKGTVYQLTKMEGQILVGLSGVQQADKLVEDGLEIEDALLRATPLKKRAERIMIGNVPFFVENLDLVAALRPFGQITSIVQKMKELGESYWADARREAFITLRDGVKLSHILARLDIKSKGVTSHVYVTYGIKCSLCYKHGHKRANCPRKTGVQEANLLLHLDPPAGPNNAGGRQPSSSNVMPAPVPTPAAGPSSTAAPIPDVSPEPPAAPPTPATSPAPPAAPAPAPETLPTASVDPVPPTSKQCRGGARKTIKSPTLSPRSEEPDKQDRERAVNRPQQYCPGADRRPARLQLRSLQAPIGRSCPDEERPMSFRLASINALGLAARERSIELCHFLRQHRVDVAFVQETNTSSLDPIQHLCLGYSAATVPPAALRGSGLACFFAPGVAVLRQRVLWPGNISIVSIDVRGQEVRVINCHLSHIPRERLEQLESITAAAIQEDAWVMGDLNIDEQSPSDITSGSVEALTELKDQTALVDVATLFDAEHLPTRVASCRSRVDAARLDRILLPSRLLERVTLYKTIYYRLSDHRAVLTQMGSPPSPRQPCVAAMLRSALVDEHLLATIERTSGSIADMSSEALWIRWSKIKAELLAEVRSLHVPRVADDDHISRARRYLQARLEAASSAADYPSRPDLVRSLRVRRPAGTTIRDEDGSVIDGGELRRRAYSVYQRRFACESGDPIAAAEFIRGTTTILTLEEDDPLTRPDITGADIAAAIRRLPLGKAPGWDELPCEFLITYEEFFVEALRRVFEASKLRGALPSSIRRSTICLVPKSNGGPGLSGYRPISLPTADYRVLGNNLLQRLRPHLPALVPRCQTYAVPGRSPSWNVARVADEIDMATMNGSELAVISTDLESAFDTLDRCFLVSLMVSLRLPPAFVEWFLLLYAGADAAVRAGGLHTKPFHLLNGVRQGCAISAALFSLATGPLLVRLERAPGPGNVLAYADDIVLLIRRDELFDVEQHLALLESAVARWVPFTRGLSLVGRARAANSLVLSAVVHHLHGYLPTDFTIAKLQARLVRFVWGPRRTTWLPGGVLARPVSVGGFGLLDIGAQLRLACLRGVQTALRGGLNAYSWLAVSGTWLTPPTSGTWHPPRRRRLLKLWEAVSEILELNHRVLPPHQLQELHIIGDSRFLRPPDLLVASRWAGMRVGDLTSSSSLPLRTTRAALADIAALTTFCSRIVEENRNHTHRVDNIKDGIVLRGTATAFQRLTTRTARRMLERPRLAALPITQLLARWLPHVSIPISISWPSLRRGAFSGHNADVAVRLALHAPSPSSASGLSPGVLHRLWVRRPITGPPLLVLLVARLSVLEKYEFTPYLFRTRAMAADLQEYGMKQVD